MTEIKEKIKKELNLKCEIDKIRLRWVSKYLEAERILRGGNIPLKKLNPDNPANVLIEIIENSEDLNENSLLLYITVNRFSRILFLFIVLLKVKVLYLINGLH